MQKYTILGYPLKHTMSPQIHKKLFELAGISDIEYTISEIEPENLLSKKDFLNSLDGYNITIPYKMDIIDFIDELDVSAKRYNAVNCVVNRNGKTTGYNTDCYGFLRALQAENISPDGNVLLLGCGGAGRMMAIETALHAGNLTIASRNKEQAEKVVADIKAVVPDSTNYTVKITTFDKIEGNYDLLINSTPVGMFPKVDFSPVSKEIVSRCSFVFDAVYNPDKTLLMQYADEMSVKSLGGMSMLVWQAVIAHEIWNGSEYNDSDINKLISEMQALLK